MTVENEGTNEETTSVTIERATSQAADFTDLRAKTLAFYAESRVERLDAADPELFEPQELKQLETNFFAVAFLREWMDACLPEQQGSQISLVAAYSSFFDFWASTINALEASYGEDSPGIRMLGPCPLSMSYMADILAVNSLAGVEQTDLINIILNNVRLIHYDDLNQSEQAKLFEFVVGRVFSSQPEELEKIAQDWTPKLLAHINSIIQAKPQFKLP